MDRTALAREMFDTHQRMKDEIQNLKAAVAFAAKRAPQSAVVIDVGAAAKKLEALVKRGEAAIAGYVATEEPGAITPG